MSRGTWAIYTSVDGGQNYTSDGFLYRPNADFEISTLSTQMKSKLADGSNAYIHPEIKYTKEPLTFTWQEISASDAFVSKIQTYIQNGTYLKITDHLSEDHIGKFTSLRRVWLSGKDDTVDLQAIFERMTS